MKIREEIIYVGMLFGAVFALGYFIDNRIDAKTESTSVMIHEIKDRVIRIENYLMPKQKE